MFGTYRTALALMVFAYHIAKVPNVGPFAVHGFFVLSGFLMTSVMHRTYGYTLSGVPRFAMNRALRLYPQNAFVILATVVAAQVVGWDVLNAYYPTISAPEGIGAWLSHLLLIYPDLTPVDYKPLLVPPSWALTLELVFYGAIAVGISRSRDLVLIWLMISVIITAWLAFTSDAATQFNWDMIYYTIPSASLPFSLGATVFFYKDKFSVRSRQIQVASVLFVAFIALAFLAAYFQHQEANSPLPLIAFYANMLVHAAIVLTLSKLDAGKTTKVIDGWIGRLSYPIYLTHFLIAAMVSYYWFEGITPMRSIAGISVFTVSLFFVLLASAMMATLIDWPVDRVRSTFKVPPDRLRENR